MARANNCTRILKGAAATVEAVGTGVSVGSAAVDIYQNGLSVDNGLHLLSGAVAAAQTVSNYRNSCFTGETRLLARGAWGEGYRRIDELTTADEVLSRDEVDEKSKGKGTIQ